MPSGSSRFGSNERLSLNYLVISCSFLAAGRYVNFWNLVTDGLFAYLNLKFPMAYDEKLADRIRRRMSNIRRVEEKPMMGGLTFMVNGKMCVGIIKNELMCRIDKGFHEQAIEKRGCRTMDFTNRPMIGYVLIDETGIKTDKDFDYWINLSLEFNKIAKASKKRKVAVQAKKVVSKKKPHGKRK